MSYNKERYLKRKARLHAQGLSSNGRPWNPRKRHSLAESLERSAGRFWSKVDKSGECWTWRAGFNPAGYGKFKLSYDGKSHTVPSHRVSFMLSNGSIPTGMVVCHKCDNPKCVNPSHLWLGTPAENMVDKVEKGRQARGHSLSMAIAGKIKNQVRGTRCHSAILNERNIIEIREMIFAGMTQREVARMFGVSFQTICNIVNRKSWRHVA